MNISLPKGATLGLAGPNGAGKSTLLKVLFGLYPMSGGEAEIFGYRLGRDSHRIRQHTGYLPDKLPFSWEKVNDLVTGYAYLNGYSFASARGRASESLRAYDMEGFGNKRFRQLSEGMKRRVLLAMTTIHNPDLLLLDEPTASLDLSGAQKVEEMIRRQRGEGRTVLLVTHKASQIQRLCTHLVVIIRGGIAYQGTPQDFIDRMHQDELIIPNEELKHVKIAPADINRFQLKPLGRYTVVPSDHWDEFRNTLNLEPEELHARSPSKNLSYSLAKFYAFGLSETKVSS